MKIYFGIDCAPGMVRPDVYAKSVFERLGVEPMSPKSTLFGAWKWEVSVDDDFNWEDFKLWMKSRMNFLYGKGYIRGAEWDLVPDKSNQ